MQYGKVSSWIWLSLLSLTMIYVSTQATALDPVTMRQVLPAYAVLENVDLLNSSKCRMEVDEFRNAVDNQIFWGLRALDTSGVPPGGFISGHNYWLGDRMGCTILSQNRTLFVSEGKRKNNTIYRNPNEEHPPFEFRFFIGRMRHNSTMQYHQEMPDEDLITLGLCLPASCTKRDVATMLDKTLHDKILLIGKLFAVHFRLIEVTDLVNDYQWLLSAKMISIIGILLLLCTTVTAATVYDIFGHRTRVNSKNEIIALQGGNTEELENGTQGERKTDHTGSTPSESREQNRMNQYLLCFSLLRNVRQIFKVKEDVENLRIFHGIKVLGMLWIILAHLIMYGLNTMANKSHLYLMIDEVPARMIFNTTFLVDTFFFMSGFLTSYIFLKKHQKMERVPSIIERVNMFLQIIMKRYIRLTPAYFVVILIAILNFTWHDHVSALLPFEHPSAKCSKYWWTNILYINNFYHWDDLCLTWSWYLPNDMQFFVFGNFLLILSSTHYNIAIGLGVFSLVSSIESVAYVGYTLNYEPTLDEQYKTLTYVYIRPWCRISPYLIGMATCHLLSKCNYELRLSKKFLVLGWTLAILCNCSILFTPVNHNTSLNLVVLYLALSRTGWALGIAWLVVVCTTNHAGIVKKILSLDIFVVLSKLTYGVYLLNPILILSAFSSSYYPFYADNVTIVTLFVTMTVCSFSASILLCATIEMPFMRLYNSARRKAKRHNSS
ncbi:nose resistant to fluoxetine protein 6-like [Bombus vosnesenskii]|uniref:Nose resistant to fluoxetine protein 6-like n=1 Tax=Bombus vosnesenskii TaxID=207650 RepID=A0A6J3L6B1_9HYME|nr:nose resistant to fluoxetine protein 6-like [Bombus vosnesenskii]